MQMYEETMTYTEEIKIEKILKNDSYLLKLK